MPSNLDALYALSTSDTLTNAKRSFYDNLIADLTVTQGEMTVISAVVDGAKTQIVLSDSLRFDCDCGQCVLDSPCNHIVATALFFEDKHPSYSKSGTDAAALTLVSHYQQMPMRRPEEGERLDLCPIVVPMGCGMAIKLFIGDRPYKVRNIPAFLYRTDHREFYRYGTDLAFFHDKERFSPVAATLIDIMSGVATERSRGYASGQLKNADRQETAKDCLVFAPPDIDLFFDCIAGLPVVVENEVRTTLSVIAEVDSFRPVVTVTKSKDGYTVSLSGKPQNTIMGRRYCYFVAAGGIFRCSRQYLDLVSPILRMLAAKQSVFVASADMPQFYSGVLCSAKEFVSIVSDTELSGLATKKLQASLVLKSEGEAVEAELVTKYGDQPVDISADFYGGNRDFYHESRLRLALEKYFPCFPELRLEDEAEIYNLIAVGLPEISRFAEVYAREDSLLKIQRPPKVSIKLRLSGSLIDVDFFAGEISDDDFAAILGGLKSGKGYVRLSNGRFVTLADPVFNSLRAVGQAGEFKKSFSLPAYYAPFLSDELLSEEVAGLNVERDKGFSALLAEIVDFDAQPYDPPAALKNVLRDYQKSGFKWLKTLKKCGCGGILADDMGLGKSLQLISLLLSERCFPCLIVCPSTLVLNWEAELTKFAPDLRVLKSFGTHEKRHSELADISGYDVIITSYKLLSRDIDIYKNIKFKLAACDEAQFIKNPDTVSFKACGQLVAEHRLALTGTPIENNMSELWSVFDFIMPGFLGTYGEFARRFEVPLLGGDRTAAERLVSKTKPFILRRLKSEVLRELPEKTETEVLVALEGEQAELYHKTLRAIRENMSEYKNKLSVLAQLMRLRQICCDPRLIDSEYTGGSAKTDLAVELATNAAAGGHKVLIFSQFTSMLEILRGRLEAEGLTHYLLRGSTPKGERMAMINRFNKDDTQVFLISLRAGGTGINLTGADTVILYDPWWNNSVMNQAADRAYRLGQQKNVTIYKLIMQGSIEQKILRLGQKKDMLSGMIVDGNNLSDAAIATLLE